MKKKIVELYVGIFVIIGLVCSFYLITELGEFDIMGENNYSIYAYFNSVSGLKKNANVEIAGVKIGHVKNIILDTKQYLAKIELNINKNIILSEDVIASVKTSGIIGDKYINLLSGGSEIILKQGDIIFNTESSVDIESLVSKYIFNKN
ncbi:MAG: outer membrane lipid asymmetry maintenance protein MlaD [Desulfobacteraceae bacterium 4572_130]|nr:MAG: outer membrane lipid asymmetry maintenance protein MlaD [Desulfobacteraceae bacterium 4572_130]